MRGAREAGVEGTDGDLDVVEQAFGDFATVQVTARDVAHGLVHRLVVVGGRDNQVGHRDQVVLVDAVMVEKRAARRFDDADPFHPALAFDRLFKDEAHAGDAWPPALFEQYAHEIVGRAHACGARVVINMDVGLARRCGADGVHLTAAQLREYGSRPDAALVGVSCHSAEELRKAEALDADFAVLGPVLPTPTHPGAQLLGWTGLAQHAANARIPVFALGGVQPDDLQQALCCGAHGIAMVRGAWGPGASLV